jgi:ferrous iron transport protein B
LKKQISIALVGNPNSGKSSLFNSLTGLNQKVGNFPGVTVDKKTGYSRISDSLSATVMDLPGMYSLYPRRDDEWVSYKILLEEKTNPVDVILLVTDASSLKRNLLFCSQILDLKKPVVIALTMQDIASKKNILVDVPGLERELGVLVVPVNPRKNKGLVQLKKAIENTATNPKMKNAEEFFKTKSLAPQAVTSIQQLLPAANDYQAIHYLINHEDLSFDSATQEAIENIETATGFNAAKTQAEEILERYKKIKAVIKQTVVEADPLQRIIISQKLDDILLHRVWGYVILMGVLFTIFQSIFLIAQYPMNFIEWVFGEFSGWLGQILQQGWFKDLLINGIIAGLSGILVFVPQIMILFALITFLEDTGYMARISFLTDKIMRKAGLNGKSVMPMISGLACAVPAIMSARNIENKKERLLTIMCTPLMSCSARLPVYTILTALIVPNKLLLGFISLQGIVMMSMYLLGTVMALASAYVMKFFIKSKQKSFFILELPTYRPPRWKNMAYTMVEKAKVFVFDAGKVIMVISLILWVLSTYGPPGDMQKVREKYERIAASSGDPSRRMQKTKNTEILENSYAGMLGKFIEPAIKPLGFDWKIGIALITSFAAREVFVGTMATLYSVGEENDRITLREKMNAAVRPDGSKVYDVATGMSLLIFYALAMQCMSTLAIVKRETRSWKWPTVQFIYMTGLAYVMSFFAYHIFNF